MVQPEPLEPEVEVPAPSSEVGQRLRQTTDAPPTASTEDEEPGEAATKEVEQVAAEQQGTTRDSTRRPPSSLGFEVVIAPDADIELTLQVRFAIYTQHFPTFEEQRDELGRIVQDQADPTQPTPPRQTVSLLEVFERRVVEVPPVTIRVNPRQRAERLNDDGAVQRALDAALAEATASPTIARAITANAVVPPKRSRMPLPFRTFCAASPPVA